MTLTSFRTPMPIERLLFAELLGDFLVLNLTTMVWSNLSLAALGTPPPARFHHGVTVSGGRLFVFGGCNDPAGAVDGGPGTDDGAFDFAFETTRVASVFIACMISHSC